MSAGLAWPAGWPRWSSEMGKRGPKPIPPERRRSVKLTIWVRPDVADNMFAAMGRRHDELSRWTSHQFEMFLDRERKIIASQVSRNAAEV